jgi:hypothetical protein
MNNAYQILTITVGDKVFTKRINPSEVTKLIENIQKVLVEDFKFSART